MSDNENGNGSSHEDNSSANASKENTRIYVGGLSSRISEKEIEEKFGKYGKVNSVSLKRGYGFVEFDTLAEAEDAIKELNKTNWEGNEIVVEMSTGVSRPKSRGGPPKHTSYRVVVDGLSSNCNWRDIKDFVRPIGIPSYANVYRDGTGVVEFETYDDMKRALRKLDGTRFQGRTIYLKEDRGKSRYSPYSRDSRSSRRRSRSRSRSRTRSRSRGSRSSRRSRRSRTRSRSRDRDRRRSKSRSRSRSRSK